MSAVDGFLPKIKSNTNEIDRQSIFGREQGSSSSHFQQLSNIQSESRDELENIQQISLEMLKNSAGPGLYDKALESFDEKKRYRLFIDLDCQILGPDVFNYKEPNYRQAMEGGLQYIRRQIGKKFDSKKFERLHRKCTDGVGGLKTKGYRKKGVYYELPNRKIEGVVLAELTRAFSDLPMDEESIWWKSLPESIRNATEKQAFYYYVIPFEQYQGMTIVDHSPLGKEMIVQGVDSFFSKYYKKISKADSEVKRLKAIVDLCRSLEVLHPFTDGNQRTIVSALLPKLLIENQFCPTILQNPTVFDGDLTVKELVIQVREGMQRFKDYEQEDEFRLIPSDAAFAIERALKRENDGVLIKVLQCMRPEELSSDSLASIWKFSLDLTKSDDGDVAKNLVNRLCETGHIGVLSQDAFVQGINASLGSNPTSEQKERVRSLCEQSGRMSELTFQQKEVLYAT